MLIILLNISSLYSGAKPSDGVPDMTAISEIDEYGINENLQVRYRQDKIYVSFLITMVIYHDHLYTDLHWLNLGGCKSIQNTVYL